MQTENVEVESQFRTDLYRTFHPKTAKYISFVKLLSISGSIPPLEMVARSHRKNLNLLLMKIMLMMMVLLRKLKKRFQ